MGNKRSNKNSSSGIIEYTPSNAARYLKITDDYQLQVLFSNGVEKLFDMSGLIQTEKHFSPLKDKELFRKAQIDVDCYAIVWNDKIDLAIEEVWDNGITVATAFSSLISMKTATDMWGLEESTLRKAIQHNKFIVGEDIFKFGKQWVLVKGAVEREYGLCVSEKITAIEKEMADYDNPNSMVAQYYSNHPEQRSKLEAAKTELKQELAKLKSRIHQ